ncbi:MAG: hypothetical protein EBW52_07440, partial [Betaproteobacteria bacterium]|nr:hypothetical protein [Betaproteobacteria bacterium]
MYGAKRFELSLTRPGRDPLHCACTAVVPEDADLGLVLEFQAIEQRRRVDRENRIFDSAKSSVIDVAFPLAGTMVFFLGLMNIAEKAGAIQKLAKWMNPFLSRLFPGVPANHPAMGQMVMNFSANMLGLDNAATPFGLKAMESLQSLNPEKEKATNAQIMFLVLHTSGLTIIPLTIISYRLAAGSHDAASIFIPCVLATIGTTLASIVMVGLYQKLIPLNESPAIEVITELERIKGELANPLVFLQVF